MVAFVIVGLVVIALFNTLVALMGLFKSEGCVAALTLVTLAGIVVGIEVLAALLLVQLL